MLTTISDSFLITPKPRHCGHFSSGTLPAPRQVSQTRTLVKLPRKERRGSGRLPFPLQAEQIFSPTPGLAPPPLQISHKLDLVMKIFLSTPKIDSSKTISKSIEISWPR